MRQAPLVPILRVRKLRLRPIKGLFKIAGHMVVEPALGLVQKAKLWILHFPRLEKANPRKKQVWADPHLEVSDPAPKG